MKHNTDLSNKTIVITGASSGVGKAMALALAARGAQLVLAARRKDALEELAEECEAMGASALAVPADMSKSEDILFLAERANSFGDKIDIWINNAGVLAAGEFETIPAAVNEEVIRVNLLGYMHAAHTVLPYFKRQGYGLLINNISVGGWFPTPYGTAYTASKFGLRGFTEALRGELQGFDDIHICDLFPAFLDTPGMQHAANYTGKVLKPVPPVYAPQKVANAVVELIARPRAKTTVGIVATALRLSWLLIPAISRYATVTLIRTYLKKAKDIEYTSGNTLSPVAYGTSVEGGWKSSSTTRVSSPGISMMIAALAGVAIGLAVSKKK